MNKSKASNKNTKKKNNNKQEKIAIKEVAKPKKIKEVKIKKLENKNIENPIKEEKNIHIFFCLVSVILSILYFATIIYQSYITAPIPVIKEVYIDDNNNAIIKFETKNVSHNKTYILYKYDNEVPSIDDPAWVLTNNSDFSFKLNDQINYAFIKNEDNIIFEIKEVSSLGKVTSFTLEKEKIYIAINGSYNIKYSFDKIGNVPEKPTFLTSNKTIATVDEDGVIKGISDGIATIDIELSNIKQEIEVVVTKLITALPDSYFDYNKSYLPCNIYNKSENDLLDKILADRINDTGYQTRAGVVEAARFLTLEFPYRINYFYENGRLTKNGIDGEGRYYHTGLYLESSRYGSISASLNGPKAWGCDIYSTPAKRNIANGLDCSGFVTWALLNGGYDPKDIGAGITNITDLTDLGEVVKNSNSTLNRIKVGDLLHNNKSGGHIAILVGKDNDNYYVAQALWYDEIGVIITKHSKSNLIKEFPRVVLMDKYYKNDGNLSDYWK